jgi:hypothetical protein
MTTTGLLIVGGAVLFSHFLFPLIWWNALGGREMRAREYQMLTMDAPTPARPALPIVSDGAAPHAGMAPVLPLAGRPVQTAPPVLPMVGSRADQPPLPAPFLPLKR